MAPAKTVNLSGTVEAVNASGIKLQDGPWFNYSNYGFHPDKGMTPPKPGQSVNLEIRNDKFIHALVIAGPTPAPQPQTQTQAQPDPAWQIHNAPANLTQLPPPTTTVHNMLAEQDTLIKATIDTRKDVLKVLSVAKPELFDLDKLDVLVETAKQLTDFVLEDLVAATTPEPDPSEDDLLEDDEETI